MNEKPLILSDELFEIETLHDVDFTASAVICTCEGTSTCSNSNNSSSGD